MLTTLITLITTNKAVISVLAAWICREYPLISSHGGILGLAKNFLVGVKPKQ